MLLELVGGVSRGIRIGRTGVCEIIIVFLAGAGLCLIELVVLDFFELDHGVDWSGFLRAKGYLL